MSAAQAMANIPGLESAALPPDAVEVARILGAWGIKGWFKVLPHSADPQALFSSRRWFLLPAAPQGVTRTADAMPPGPGTCQLLPIREAKDHSDSVVASSFAVPDRNAAEMLKGARVFVARSSFPTAQKDEYYWVDLIGMSVVNREGCVFGEVKDLMQTGPQSVLVVTSELDGKIQETLIPFVAAFVDDVDTANRRITVDWQADY
ncbi:MAG: putative rRNA processing protein rimM [Pseudomonadota bacterium]